MPTTMEHIKPGPEIIASDLYQVMSVGEEIFVYQCPVASYALLFGTGPLEVEIRAEFPFREVKVRPLNLAITPVIDGSTVRFTLPAPAKVSVEFDGDIRNPLFLLANPPETDKPDPKDPSVRFFTAGQVYDAGLMEMKSGETIYIEAGAVVYGAIVAHKAENITIKGRGILEGARWARERNAERQRMIRLVECQNVSIEGITVVNGPSWHVVPNGCNDVTIRDLNIITEAGTGDGIDIVSSRNVIVENCFIRSKDDCIAVKAVNYLPDELCANVEHVRVRDCVLWNAEWGNAIEIGYETRCEEITDIIFSNCDIIRCEFEGYQSGGTFTIHNGDRAVVHNVQYENIRVEDAQEKLFDIKVQMSQYSRDQERGQVRDICFKDIQVVDGIFPVSIIRGYDKAHLISSITFDNLMVHGRKIENANEARMVVEIAREVRFL